MGLMPAITPLTKCECNDALCRLRLEMTACTDPAATLPVGSSSLPEYQQQIWTVKAPVRESNRATRCAAQLERGSR